MVSAVIPRRIITATVVLLAAKQINAEYRQFDGIIQAAASYIHYSEGFVIAPASIDISDLKFSTIDDDSSGGGGGPMKNGVDQSSPYSSSGGGATSGDSTGIPKEYTDDEEEQGEWNDNDDTGALKVGEDDDNRQLGELAINEGGGSVVDIVIFQEPPSCANTYLGCDWSTLGVGGNDGVGNLRWCCSGDAISLGLCVGGPNQQGRLIINHQFNGEHVVLPVPSSSSSSSSSGSSSSSSSSSSSKWENMHLGVLSPGYFPLQQGTGKYILIVANCNEITGRDLAVTGQYYWKSKHGYLPGNLFGEMHFYSITCIFFILLLSWYACKMSIYRDAIVLIQKWILATIIMGLLESFFKAGDLWVWNIDGTRFWFALYTGVIVGVLKRAISRVLVVMLCLGLGVTCNTLGSTMKKVIMLGVAYAGASAARDVMTVLAITENEVLSITAETEILDVVVLLSFITAFIDVCFYLWIFGALNETMKSLEDMNQSRKLQRYLRLRMILLFSALFALVWTVFGIVDSYNDQRIVHEEVNGWVLTAVWELSYLFALVGISCLWTPEAGAKEYAYMQELTGNDLELTNVDGPDSDDDDPSRFVSNEYGENDDDFEDLDVNRGVNT